MIKLIVGKKGAGKTKQMMDMINENLKTVKGNIVCIEKSTQLAYNISTSVRLVDVDEYKIDSYDTFYGFFAGILAGNYDIEQIYVDGILKINDIEMDGLGALLEKIDIISKETLVVFTVSADKDELPVNIKKYL
ncbi:MAG: hypothetical protein RR846_06770 [Oscillospiraceae bacterium]